MKRKPLTNKEGEVRELTQADINTMRPAREILPPEFIATFLKHKQSLGLDVAVAEIISCIHEGRRV
jgi:hypothetical protein